MKTNKNKLFTILLLAVLVTFTTSFFGCKDDKTTDPPAVETVPDEIFPLIAGRVILYNSGNLLVQDTETPVPGSDANYQSKWIIAGTTTFPVPPYTTPTAILDTTTVFSSITVGRTFLIHRDTTTNTFHFLTNLGYFFRSQNIQDGSGNIRADSLRWIALAKPKEGLGKKWTAFSETFTSATLGNVRLEITGEFEAKETLTAAGQSWTTYRLVATRYVYLGTSTSPVSTGITARLWLVENVGPVKIELRGDAESNGKIQTMTAKNF